MLVYLVTWTPSEKLVKGKKFEVIGYRVLCRCSNDALTCFESIFHTSHRHKGLDILDGDISIHRVKLDSRNFEVDFLFMDGISRPIDMRDLKKSLINYFPRIIV